MLNTCTFMSRQHGQDLVCTIEPLFFNMTLGMHRRSFDDRQLVHFITFVGKGVLCGIFNGVLYQQKGFLPQ